ncbi:MAG: ABC transporter ATP-binding protein [Eubacterium sp.]|nr:ABC transporter ATP-binding protein [Eubacterium sp.]
MSENIIQIKDVSRTYLDADKENVEALKNVSLNIKQGEFVSIIGPSGCGKTTLLRLIAGLDRPESGKVLLEEKEIQEPGPETGYVFQQGGLFPWLTVKDNVAIGLKARRVYKENKHKVTELLKAVGLEDFKSAYPHQISGGMAQRVSMARALINDPKVLLLDEPMGALDAFTRIDLQDKILELWKEKNTTMVLVTHDVDEAIYLSDKIVIMTQRPGKISEVMEVKLPRPRNRATEEFSVYRSKILKKLHLASEIPEPEYII